MDTKEVINIAEEEIKTQSRGIFEFLNYSDCNFEGKKEDEEIIVFSRRHWFVLLSPIIGSIFASVVPLILVIIGAKILVQYNLSNVFTLCWVIYIMIICFSLFYKLTMHSLDTWIVTNKRVIDILQIGLFKRKVSELHLESIQDISVHTDGIIQSYLNFGNVEIQTGGAVLRFLFEEVPNPIEIKSLTMEAARKFEINNDKKFI